MRRIGIELAAIMAFSVALVSCQSADRQGTALPACQRSARGTSDDHSSCSVGEDSTATGPAQGDIRILDGDGFILEYPPKVSVQRGPEIVDFVIYRFSCGDKLILSVYVGNHPSKSILSRLISGVTGNPKQKINGLSCERTRVPGANGATRAEVVIELPTDDRIWPMYLHFWHADLPPTLERISEGIIGSVRAQQAGSTPHLDLATSNPRQWHLRFLENSERRLNWLMHAAETGDDFVYPTGYAGKRIPIDVQIAETKEEIENIKSRLRAIENSVGEDEG